MIHSVSITEGKLRCVADFEDRHALKQIPTARWNPKRRAWDFEPSPHVVLDLIDVGLMPTTVPDEVRWLVIEAEQMAAASAVKTCEPGALDIYNTKTPQWLHQRRCAAFFARVRRGMFWMGMGTGKTKSAIDAAREVCADRVLVLCPKSAIPVWPGELRKHADDVGVVLALDGGTVANKAKRAEAVLRGGRFWVVLNYESAWRDPLAKHLLSGKWDLVILDESQKIKSAGGQASKFAAKLCRWDNAKRVWALTGTPMPNGAVDLYGQWRAIDPGVLGTSLATFKARYCQMGGYQQKQIVRYQNQVEMAARIDRATFHATRDVIDLPPSHDVDRWFDLGTEERRVYGELEAALVSGVEAGEITADNGLVKLLKLSQAAHGMAKTDGGKEISLGKSRADALAEVIDEIDAMEPVVVFCRFRHDLDEVARVCRDLRRSCLELSGRKNQLDGWQAGMADVLAVQIQSGNAGIDLTRARYAVFYGGTYSLGDYEQARARCHRPGQDRDVINVHLCARRTVDVQIRAALKKKAQVVADVLENIVEVSA